MTTVVVRSLGAAVLAAVLTLTSGWFAREGHAAPCGGPAETTKITMMADWLPWPGQGPMWHAKLSGIFKAEGLDVDIIAPANPADPIKLVAREKVHFSQTYVPEVMLARETGIPVVSVATTLRILVSGLMLLDDHPIKSPADLKGKILGVGPKQDAQAFLRTLLKAGGLTMKDVKVVDPGFAHVALTTEGKVDAAHALTYGEGIVINDFLGKQGKKPVRWLMYRDHGVPTFYYQLLVGNENWTKSNPNAVCRFLAAVEKGAEAYFRAPASTNKFIAQKNEIFTPQQHDMITEAIKNDWKSSAGKYFVQDVSVWKKAQDWALGQKFISVPSDPAAYFTNAYLPKG